VGPISKFCCGAGLKELGALKVLTLKFYK